MQLLQMNWQEFETRIGGEPISSFLWCAGIIVLTMLLKKPAANLMVRLSVKFANRFTDKEGRKVFFNLTEKPMEWLLQTVFFYIAINQLNILLNKFVIERYQSKIDEFTKSRKQIFAVSFGDIVDHIFWLLFILLTILLLSRIVDFIYYIRRNKAFDEANIEHQQLLPLIKEVFKLTLWIIGLFWVLGVVFHVNIPALITGLGIGGIALALAAKTTLENLIAAFTILTDKPFQSGDTVKLGSIEGKVERIGFRSTRLRNPDGSLYIVPNQKLVNENLENLSKRDVRKVKLVLNLKYGIAADDLQKLIDDLKQMVVKTTHVKEPIDVSIDSFGENVFQLIISYHLPEPLAENVSLSAIKQEVSARTYEIVSRYNTPVPTTSTTITNTPIEPNDEELPA